MLATIAGTASWRKVNADMEGTARREVVPMLECVMPLRMCRKKLLHGQADAGDQMPESIET